MEVKFRQNHVACDFTVTPKNVCAMPGDEVELQCSLDGDVIQSWKHPSKVYISENHKIQEKYKDKYAIIGEYNLRILQLGFNDAGTYSCGETNSSIQQFKGDVIVIENGPHIMSNAPGDLILENEVIRFTCHVRYAGKIIPSMRWTLISHTMFINHKTNNQPGLAQTYIDVTGDALTNGKSFMCTLFFEDPVVVDDFAASNAPDCTMETSSGILTVHYKPRNTTITLPSGAKVVSNDTLKTGDVLRCQTESNPKHVTYEWIVVTDNKSKILGHSQTFILHNEQFGIASVRCTVTNYMGRDLSTKGSDAVMVVVNVISMPGSLETTPDNTCTNLGESVELECSYDGQAPLSWLLPNGVRISDSRKMSTTSIQSFPHMVIGAFKDAGTYTCMDTRNNVQSKAELIVLGPISMTTFPEVSEIQGGDHIRHTCKAKYAGSLNATFEWRSSSGDVIDSEWYITELAGGVRAVRSHLDIKADKLNYSCKLFFSEDENKISGQDVASNVPGCFAEHTSVSLLVHGSIDAFNNQPESKTVVSLTAKSLVFICAFGIIGILICIMAIYICWLKCRPGDFPERAQPIEHVLLSRLQGTNYHEGNNGEVLTAGRKLYFKHTTKTDENGARCETQEVLFDDNRARERSVSNTFNYQSNNNSTALFQV